MRILVFGATGMLGHKMWQRLHQHFPDTFATMRSPYADFARCGLFQRDRIIDQLDVADFHAAVRILDDVRPNVIVNCIAITKRRGESADPLASIELNAALPHRLASWSQARGARLIHFSTDCVFNGQAGNYDESSPTTAEDLYGRTKALGEVDVVGVLTLRTSLIGRELKGRTELLEWLLAQGGRTIHGYRKALYTGVSTLFMSDLVIEILQQFPGLSGIYQVAAPVISKYELLRLARDAFRLDVDIQPDDSVVMRRNLNGIRFREATGIAVPHWSKMMDAIEADPTPYEH